MQKNILLVDDDNIANFISTTVLHRIGFNEGIHTALNGQEALDLINGYFSGSRYIPDIIFLDLSMPVMDGFAFIEAFNRLNLPKIERVLTIVVTSSDNPGDMERARNLGITDYIVKPITQEGVRRILQSNGIPV